MNSWFDIATLDMDGPEDDQGIKAAAKTVEDLIEAEIAAGIPEERIVVGGFSQGGATSVCFLILRVREVPSDNCHSYTLRSLQSIRLLVPSLCLHGFLRGSHSPRSVNSH